jgi:hypothetical protein
MDYFGGRNVSSIIGVLYTSVAFGTLIGPSCRKMSDQHRDVGETFIPERTLR